MSEQKKTSPLDPAAVLGEHDDRVFGIIDHPDVDVPELMSKLADLDVDPDMVHVYQGETGLQQLSPGFDGADGGVGVGGGGGVLSGIKRAIQSLGEEGRYVDRIREELKAGHGLITVSVDENNRSLVIAAMKQQGAHHMYRYGKLTIIDL